VFSRSILPSWGSNRPSVRETTKSPISLILVEEDMREKKSEKRTHPPTLQHFLPPLLGVELRVSFFELRDTLLLVRGVMAGGRQREKTRLPRLKEENAAKGGGRTDMNCVSGKRESARRRQRGGIQKREETSARFEKRETTKEQSEPCCT
jgi:hypothetical protein